MMIVSVSTLMKGKYLPSLMKHFFNVFDTESYDIGSLTYGCSMIE